MEVGIEDCLHIEFEFDKQKYHLKVSEVQSSESVCMMSSSCCKGIISFIIVIIMLYTLMYYLLLYYHVWYIYIHYIVIIH